MIKEATIIMVLFLGLGIYFNRNYIKQYIKTYPGEFKRALEGKPSHLETVHVDSKTIKRVLFLLFCAAISIICWFFIGWWTILVFLILYLSIGLILMHFGGI